MLLFPAVQVRRLRQALLQTMPHDATALFRIAHNAGKVVEYADGKSERTIISIINRLSVTSLKEDSK